MCSGGESGHAKAGRSVSVPGQPPAAAESISVLPEPCAAQSPWSLLLHNPAFSHHGNEMLLKNGLCFPFCMPI